MQWYSFEQLNRTEFGWTGENDSPNMRRHVFIYFFFFILKTEKKISVFKNTQIHLDEALISHLIFRVGLLWKDNLSQTTAHRL